MERRISRWIRFYEKKRGNRRTGSQKFANLGEAAFFSVFLIIGLMALTTLLSWLIIPEWRANRQFVETAGTILRKRVDAKQRPRSGTVDYRPRVVVRYEVDGRTYERATFDAVNTRFDTRAQAERAAEKFVVGRNYPLWYDPRDPGRVVLVKGYSGWLYLFLLVPLPFITIGATGIIYSMMQWGTSLERRSALARRAAQIDPFELGSADQIRFPTVPREGNLTNSPGTTLAYRLPVTAAPGWRLFATLVACVGWNSMVALLVTLAVQRHRRGDPDWLLTSFVVPFAVVGVGLAIYFLRQLLRTTGVGATRMEIARHPLYPGQTCDLFLSQAGRMLIDSLRVELVCEEKATYRQGTDTRTEVRRVHREELFARSDFEVRQGIPFEHRVAMSVPIDAMHSFKSDHNELNWLLVVQGRVDGWPDFERVFPIVVYPALGTAVPGAAGSGAMSSAAVTL